jgi:hypothetical protein
MRLLPCASDQLLAVARLRLHPTATGNCASKSSASWECFDGEGGLALRWSDPDTPVKRGGAVGFGSGFCSTQERFASHQLVAAGRGERDSDIQVSFAFTLRLRAASASVRRIQPVASCTAELHTTLKAIITLSRRSNEDQRGV